MGAAFAFMPRWGWIVLGAGVLMVAFYFTLDAYGDSKYQQGKTQSDLEWKRAEQREITRVADAGKKADIMEANRLADHAEKVATEKEKIDAAVEDGTDPFDVLFAPAAE
jgi:hypothetical protein